MLKDLLNWDAILEQPRYAGGHCEVMAVLFKDAKVVASYRQEDWQGDLCYCYQLADGRYVIVTDSFGSCSGCDAWEDASDEEARNLCVSLANDAHAFDTLQAVIQFIEKEVPSDRSTYWHEKATIGLLPELIKVQGQQSFGAAEEYHLAV